MTQEPPPYPVDDIEVKGQRRKPGGALPRPPTTGGGGGEQQEELDPDEQPSGGSHPCDDPETALDWNADAAAAEALRRMEAAARDGGEPDFAEREYGTAIFLMPDGTFRIGSIARGDSQTGTVRFDYDEFGEENLIATIHSHPSSGGFSQDRPVLDYTRSVSRHGNSVRMYGVRLEYSTGTPLYQLLYLTIDNLNESDVATEVNPNGQPCPGISIV